MLLKNGCNAVETVISMPHLICQQFSQLVRIKAARERVQRLLFLVNLRLQNYGDGDFHVNDSNGDGYDFDFVMSFKPF